MEISAVNRKKLYVLFLVKMFSTLTFSVIFSSLALYLSVGLGVSEKLTSELVGLYIALNYVLPILGGYIGNRLLNFKSLFCLGLFVQAAGLFMLTLFHHGIPALALSLVLMGSMVNSVSIIFFVNEVAGEDKESKRVAMLYNYTAMNIGFFLGYFLAGTIGSVYHSYNTLFILLAIFPVISACMMLLLFKHNTEMAANKQQSMVKSLVLIAIILFVIYLLLTHAAQIRVYLLAAASLGMLYLFLQIFKLKQAKDKMGVLTFLFYALTSITFWSIYMMIPIVLMNFLNDDVNLNYGHLHIAPQWLNNIDPLVLIIGGPILAYLTRVIKERLNYSIPTAIFYFLGLALIALAALYLGASIATASTAKISVVIVMIFMLLVSLGELFVGPEGYTLAGRLIPSSIRGVATGIWLSTLGIASLIASYISDVILSHDQAHIMASYGKVFYHLAAVVGLVTIAIALVGGYLDRRNARLGEVA